MLGAIEKMDENLKKAFLAVFEQSEKLAKAGFDKVGHGGGKPPENPDLKKAKVDFETKVAEIRKRDSSNQQDAFRKARAEHPDLFKAYQGEDAQAQN